MSETVVIDMTAPGNADMVRALVIRSRLKLAATTKMRFGMSTLNAAHAFGLTDKRTNHGAWVDVDAWIRRNGGPAADSEIKLPNGRVIKARKRI